MKYNFIYDIIQVATEELFGNKNIVTEIRFYHTLGNNKRLYVVHLLYENNEPYITLQNIETEGKDILIPYIENILGVDQIEHMKNLLIEDSNNEKNSVISRQYINL
jgi:hypothetical protein